MARGGTCHTLSPATPIASRLVARIRRLKHVFSSASASLAQASSRCSQLSKTRRRRLERRRSTRVSINARLGCSGMRRALAVSWVTKSASDAGANSTSQTPSGYSASKSAATCSASRVLPQPPAPVRVNNLVSARSCLTSIISASRPMKLDNCAGKLLRCNRFLPRVKIALRRARIGSRRSRRSTSSASSRADG